MDEQGRGNGASDKLIFYLFWGIALTILVLILAPVFTSSGPANDEVSLTQVASEVTARRVTAIVVRGDALHVQRADGQVLISHKEPGVSLLQTLRSYGATDAEVARIDLRVEPERNWSWLGALAWVLPILLIIGLFVFLGRSAGPSGVDQAFSFGKSRARSIRVDRPSVTFADVAGVDEARQEVAEVVDFLKQPHKFLSLGARIPKGVLLVGPPGTGKTLLARAVAGEARVPFFHISCSEFVELFVGVGAARVRDLFKQAREAAPCIIFVDEIDAVGRQRGTGLGGGHDEREQTLNQILVEMDGFEPHTNIVVMAATNRPDILDPALLRPGRFDRQVVLDAPDLRGRQAILDVHARGKPIESNVSLDVLARQTPGFSGADLANLVNEAAILAARQNKTTIGMPEMEEAIDRIVAGPERRSRIISAQERRVTAFHEAGHALVAYLLPNCDPVHKLTIVARGLSGGHTRLLPTEDRRLWSRSQLTDMLAFALGGLAAEELIFGEPTTGPESDLQQATGMARRMVTEFGMSERLGPVALGRRDEMTFLGRELGHHGSYSEETASLVDHETRRLIDEARRRAQQLLTRYRDQLAHVASRLLEQETIQGDDLQALLSSAVGGQPRLRAA